MLLKSYLLPCLFLCLLVTHSSPFQITLATPQTPQSEEPNQVQVYTNSQLQQEFNNTEYHTILTCTNNMFYIVEFDLKDQNPDHQMLVFEYEGLELTQQQIRIQYKPNPTPQPELVLLDTQNKVFKIANGCPKQVDSSNYYNQLTVRFQVEQGWKQFSMLYNCEFKGRNKKFEIGYLILCALNFFIIVGVALHSRIWSIRFKNKPLCLELKWHRFLIIITSTIVVGGALYLLAGQQFKIANQLLTYIGLLVGWVFTFICMDEALFLVNSLKYEITITKKISTRICDILSLIIATLMTILTIIFQIWPTFDIMAICICVGAIKLFQFSSMKQAIISMLIYTVFVTLITSIMHFTLTRSYNDYANEIASPVFLSVPDLIDNLFKKCSWLPVLDIIIPGVFLSYLRGYDENYSNNWGGVYTIIGNLSFIAGTMIWIPVEGLYGFSVPFSFITYPVLILGVFIMAYKRNQFMTLWTGRFNGPHNQFSQKLLQIKETRQTFGKMVGNDILDQIKIKKGSSEIYE